MFTTVEEPGFKKLFYSSHSDLAASSGENAELQMSRCSQISPHGEGPTSVGAKKTPPPHPPTHPHQLHSSCHTPETLTDVSVEHANTQTGCEVRGHRGRQSKCHKSGGGTNGSLNLCPTTTPGKVVVVQKAGRRLIGRSPPGGRVHQLNRKGSLTLPVLVSLATPATVVFCSIGNHATKLIPEVVVSSDPSK